MSKLRKAAVVAALLGSVGFLGASSALADGMGGGMGGGKSGGATFDIKQTTQCQSRDTNVDILGEVGIANGLGGNLLNGEGNSGSQSTNIGSSMGCNNSAFNK
ncbi:hypothetical protein [Streptomyces natalensis]|uniref:Secreted protein n=1 Tax=Streptomyces natalensis ATCC 27448 TaxID=1240678 RepID=A0A0D7CRK3_9ACTN|nr:hypothetical protein [Streptomyces natalensis]KIZ18864.1 hypothetical protein SNA_06295 [Streptomyces natalensis ATCC 27448]